MVEVATATAVVEAGEIIDRDLTWVATRRGSFTEGPLSPSVRRLELAVAVLQREGWLQTGNDTISYKRQQEMSDLCVMRTRMSVRANPCQETFDPRIQRRQYSADRNLGDIARVAAILHRR